MNDAAFFDQLAKRVALTNSLLCVGIDPHKAELSSPTVEAAREFCTKLITATVDVAAAYKPNVAFFEVFGPPGIQLLEDICSDITSNRQVPIVLDAKRGDIGSTSEAYAESCYGLAGSVTVSPYLGRDSVQPFLQDPTKAPWVLCKTSNPGSDDFQSVEVDGPHGKEPLYMRVARLMSNCGVRGLVVGATDVAALENIRAEFEDMWFLAPGIGAQGGDLEAALQAGLNQHQSGMLLPISRGISRAPDIKAKATEFRDLINTHRTKMEKVKRLKMNPVET